MKLSIVALLGLMTLPLFAETWEDPETGIVWNYSIGQGTLSIYSVKNAKGAVSIPDLLPGPLGMHGVLQLGPYLFRGNTDITSVKIPNTVTSIGGLCFENCTNLVSVTAEGMITEIPESCFENCGKLSSVTFASPIVSIGDRAFWACGALKNFPFEDGLTMIGEEAFYDCISLEDVTVPKSVQVIESYAFVGCGSSSEVFSLTINAAKENITIGEFAFDGLEPTRFVSTWVPQSNGWFFWRLRAIGIPEGETTLPDTLLRSMVDSAGPLQAEQLTTIILPSSLRYATQKAFDIGAGEFQPTTIETCSLNGTIEIPDTITTIKIPEGTKTVPERAFAIGGFSPREQITSVIIPEGVESIATDAFTGLYNVKSFNLPASISSIDAYAFTGEYYEPCTTSITVAPENEHFVAINNILYTKDLTKVIYAAPRADIGELVLPPTINEISNGAFIKNSGLTSIVIPAGVNEVNYSTFRDCSNLRFVSLPNGLKIIRSGAFGGCQNLATINLPDSLETIERVAFQDCAALKAIEIPGNVKLIGNETFSECASLETLLINEGVETIEAEAFYGCSKVKAFHLPASVSTMPLDAFPPPWNMESLTVSEDNPIYFAQDNILYNKERTEILLVACKGVAGEIVIPEGVTHLDSYLFSRCENLTSITLPVSLTSMGSAIFAGCTNLQTVHFMGKVPEGFSMDTLYGATITYEEPYADAWKDAIAVQPNKGAFETTATVTVACEPVGNKQFRVRYTIHSDLPKAKVRAVAFQDGVRSFANFVPVRTGNGVPHGEEVSTNEEHTFVWDVARDWGTDLAKVSVEILIQEGELLPQQLQVIPTSSEHKAMTITLNYITPEQAKATLLWCLAEGDEELELKNGEVRFQTALIATGTEVITVDSWPINYSTKGSATWLLRYLYGKMGYTVLEGEDLVYAERSLRRSLRVTKKDFSNEYRTIKTVAIKIEGE